MIWRAIVVFLLFCFCTAHRSEKAVRSFYMSRRDRMGQAFAFMFVFVSVSASIPMNIVGHKARIVVWKRKPSRLGQRTANVLQAAAPVFPHG